ncbi:MAG: hypothetical protein ACRC33_22980 [Gemmataceae bacterium]
MKHFLLAAACAALLLAAPSAARAAGLGLNGGQFNLNLGVNVGITGGFNWVPGAPACGGCITGSYPYPAPYNSMQYGAYGHGHHYGYGSGYSGFYGY